MMNALIISRDKSSFKVVESVLLKNGIQTDWSDNSDDALSMLMEEPNDLVIVDETLPGMIGRLFIEKAIMTNPMINCVVASSCDKEEFNQAYGDLGVLMQFPVVPGRKEAQFLSEHMKQVFPYQAIP
jgi:DNA-binding response OmpR family regulator